MSINKIIYFDKETIHNILQERNKGERNTSIGTKSSWQLSANADIKASSSIKMDVPLIARLKFVFTGELETRYIFSHDNSVTVTSTEISEFESIKQCFIKFENQHVYDVENSTTAYRVAGGFLRMINGDIEGVNAKEFQNVMNSFEGYDTYKINNTTYVRFNNTAFLSNYHRFDLLNSTITMYCISVGSFSPGSFDLNIQIEAMQKALAGANGNKTLADTFPNDEQTKKREFEESNITEKRIINLFDVVYACITSNGEN